MEGSPPLLTRSAAILSKLPERLRKSDTASVPPGLGSVTEMVVYIAVMARVPEQIDREPLLTTLVAGGISKRILEVGPKKHEMQHRCQPIFGIAPHLTRRMEGGIAAMKAAQAGG